ncbi:MAG: 30S ribosomal subunit protein S5 [Candidatus Peregrinibacteria bacterium Greene0416_19]|nr:MAG: 30S ribosomal subunit protein S5 [Candidatus Peregrinibacteria bacterium Greene0416_19]
MSAKTSRPDRKRGDHRRQKEPSEFAEATLSVDRVTRVVKGGRRMRFRAIVVVGNRKGKVGLGTGKASEVQAAVRKATSAARRAMIRIPVVNGTIPHLIEEKFKAAKIRLMPAYEGTGIIAGGALRVILDHAGVKNVLSKRFGSRNKLVNAQATMRALKRLKWGSQSMTEEAVPAAAPEEGGKAPEGVAVKEISRKDAEKMLEDQRRAKIEE